MKLNEIITKEDLLEFEKRLLQKIEDLNKQSRSPQYLKNSDLKEMLKLSDSAIQNLRIQGLLPYSKLNGTIYYELQDVVDILERNKQKNTP